MEFFLQADFILSITEYQGELAEGWFTLQSYSSEYISIL